MKNWLEYFPLEQIHIIDGDIFSKKPWIEMQKVEKFLQIPPVITQENFFFNSTKGFYCGREIRKREIWTCIREKCLKESKGRKPQPLQNGTMDQFKEFFQHHNKQFFQLINRTFDWN